MWFLLSWNEGKMLGSDVYKFGGSSLASREAVDITARILAGSTQANLAVVVSAPQGITNLLEEGVVRQNKTGTFPPRLFNQLCSRFMEIYQGVPYADHLVDCFKWDLEKGIDCYDGRQRTSDSLVLRKYRDRIVHLGEKTHHKLYANFLREVYGLNATAVEPMALGLYVSDNFGNAKVWGISYSNIAERLKDFSGIAVIPGFYGCTLDGDVATFSRGGSDFTGAVVARGTGASVYRNCTDVNGIKRIDPRIFNGQRDIQTIPYLSYREAQELSILGAKVLHPNCIDPVRELGIPIEVRNTFDFDGEFTTIQQDKPVNGKKVEAIATKKCLDFVVLESSDMFGESGFVEKFAHALAGVDVDMIYTSPVAIVASFSSTDRLPEIASKLEEYGRVTSGREAAIVSIVGSGIDAIVMRDHYGALVKEDGSCYAVRRVTKPHELSLWTSVDPEYCDEIARRLFEVFCA